MAPAFALTPSVASARPPKPAILGGDPVRTAPWPPYPTRGQDEVDAVVAVVRRGELCASGASESQVSAFEAEFAAYCGVRHGIATSNGTTALHTALAAAGIGVGDEVIVPPYTFYSTATSVLMQHAVPVFVDVEAETQALDPVAVERAVTPRTKALIVVHMNGYPADMDGLLAVAARHRLTVIEDGSHAHGAEYRWRRVGAIGHLGAFSFQQKKNLSLGEGGMVTTDDEALAQRARAFSAFGNAPLAYNFRMTELHGAIGRARLKRLEDDNAARRRNAAYLDSALAGLPGITPQRPRPHTKAVYYNYVLKIDEQTLGVSRARFLKALGAEGIPAPAIYAPVYRHRTFQIRDAFGHGYPWADPAYGVPPERQPRYEDGICPVAEDLCDHRNVELKIHPPAAEAEMADIVAAIAKIVTQIAALRETDGAA